MVWGTAVRKVGCYSVPGQWWQNLPLSSNMASAVVLGDDVQPTSWGRKAEWILHRRFIIWVSPGGGLKSAHNPLVEMGHCWTTLGYQGGGERQLSCVLSYLVSFQITVLSISKYLENHPKEYFIWFTPKATVWRKCLFLPNSNRHIF